MSSTRTRLINATGILVILLLTSGCATSIPSSPEDLCGIFGEKRSWFLAAKRTRDRWNAPIGITMAFIYQESGYRALARPKREKIFGIIPWRRQSTALGYAQAINSTWKQYINDAKILGDWGPKYRFNFNDAVDFVGWYNYQSQKQLGLSRTEVRNLYLAYHEGWNGYKNGTYKKKRWLINVADKVDARARLYQTQYLKCKHKLSRWYDFLLPS